MPIIIEMPIMKSKPLVASLVVAACTEAARAKTMAKKNNIAAAIAPIIVIAFTLGFVYWFRI